MAMYLFHPQRVGGWVGGRAGDSRRHWMSSPDRMPRLFRPTLKDWLGRVARRRPGRAREVCTTEIAPPSRMAGNTARVSAAFMIALSRIC
jgi:hypothetical protein